MRGFESGKGFVRNFIDTLKNMFKALILRPVIEVLVNASGVGGIAASIGGLVSGTANAAGTSGASGGGVASLLSSGQNLFGAVTKGFDGLNDTFTGAISHLGASIANGQGGLADSIGGALGQYSSQIATGLAFAPAVFSLLKGDIKSAAFQGAGAAVGFAVGGPVGAAIGGALGGFVGGLFGGGGKLNPKAYANTSVSSMGASIASMRDNGGGILNAARDGSYIGGSVLGITSALGGSVPGSFNIGTAYNKKYNHTETFVGSAARQGAGDFVYTPGQEVAAAADAFLVAVKKGFITLPTYLQDIVKRSSFDLNSSQAAVSALGAYAQLNAQLKDLPAIFQAVGTSIKSIANTGNIATIQAQFNAVNAYTALFYTDAEKITTFTKQLNTQFTALGVSLPSTRDGFRKLVDGIDTTQVANLGLFNSLVALAPAMDNYYKALDQQAQATASAAQAAQQLSDALNPDNFRTLVDYTRAQRYAQNGISLDRLPSFAVGSDSLPSDMTARVHAGERIVPAADNRELMARLRDPQANSAALIAEVRQLRAENQAQQLSIVIATQKMAKILDKFDGNGIVLSEIGNDGVRTVLNTRVVA